MAVFKSFKAVRPLPEFAQRVAALPYDVMNSDEARDIVRDNPYSFLHVDKAEVDLPRGTDIYDDCVYQKAAENLSSLSEKGVCAADEKPCFYIYRQIMNGREQTGLVGCASVDDYLGNVIKKHEHTRADKEADRIRHVDTCNANTGPIFLCCPGRTDINKTVADWKATHAPVYDFDGADGNRHTVWVIDDAAVCEYISSAFEKVPSLYIADGHHRCASAVRVAQMRRAADTSYTGGEEFNYFLAVLFPAEELKIMDYNRVIADLNGYSEKDFLSAIGEKFDVKPYTGGGQYRPTEKHSFGMYLGSRWYALSAKCGTYNADDPVERLDVSILQNNLISPVLGIDDPRTDRRIDFVGGIRGLGELERRVEKGMALAFSMCPTTLDDLMAIADAGKVMPPKSTWFEPKLLSGLFIHYLS